MALPLLREELRMYEGGLDWDGSPCWLIHDPPANRFHRIGWLEFELLSRWDAETPQVLLEQVREETTLRPAVEDLANLIFFLEQHNLTRNTDPIGTARLSERAKRTESSPELWLLHNYLFFRIPLLRSDKLLDRILPPAAPFLGAKAALMYIVLALGGLYLAARQWDIFTSSFVNTLTPAGYFSYFIAIAAAKCTHELGHALLAKKAGLRVPRIGIAFMVMFPVLYTDLGEGWLLNDHRRRRLISAGGILAEGALAAVALFLWGILAEGPLRDSLYVLAVVSLARSLLINISPFMRFDGYYLLSDHLNLPNLQQRAFAYTRHLLRRIIFGKIEAPPEHLPRRLSVFFALYSVCTWVYRLVVFLGIALAVYHYFFKSLGIILMLVELLYFILFPIVRELREWGGYMSRISFARRAVVGGATGLILLMLLLPWRGRVDLPAILTARIKQPLYAPFAARVTSTSIPGKESGKGELLFLLDAEEARFQSRIASMHAAELHDRLRRTPVEQKGREQASVWLEEALEREQAVRAHSAELKRLMLSAETGGVLMDVDEGVHPGGYVTPHTLLGILVNPSSSEIEAYAAEIDAVRIHPGAKARFWSSVRSTRPLNGKVLSIDSARLNVLPTVALADRHGGPIATIPTGGERLTPRESLYRVRIRLDEQYRLSALETGQVSVEVKPGSLAGRLARHAFSVLLRESGF